MPRELVNKVGPWVTSDEFWDRESELETLLAWIEEGHHVLLVAPRRVGKTSLLREAIRRLEGRDFGLYVDLQHAASPEEAIVALSLATRPCESLWRRTLSVFKEAFASVLDRIESVGADMLELKLREGTAEAWRQRGDRLLEELAQADRRILLGLDELPVMLMRMMSEPTGELRPQGVRDVDLFLSWLRRVALEHSGRVRLVISGSIGLEPVVHRVGLSHTINHLRAFPLGPWSLEAADGCLTALAAHYGLELDGGVRSRMLDLLGWLVPHHIQMFFGLVNDDRRRRKDRRVSIDDVERVYTASMLGPRGHAELADYEERLIRVLGRELVPLALALLTQTAVSGTLSPATASSVARSMSSEGGEPAADLRAVMGVLEHDGYLVRQPAGECEFRSRLVRDWWARRFGRDHVPHHGSGELP